MAWLPVGVNKYGVDISRPPVCSSTAFSFKPVLILSNNMNAFISLALLITSAILVKCDVTTEIPTTHDGASTIAGSTVSKPDDIRQKIKDQVAGLTEQCKNTLKIPQEQAKIAVNQGIPKTEPEKCFLECIYQGLNLTKEGKFNEPAARGLAQLRFAASQDELAKANTMIDNCVKEVVVKDSTEKCALGRLVRECFVKHGSKINFFPKP